MSKPVVAISGVNGFLGQKVIEAFTSDLFREKYQLPVRVLTRDPSKFTDTADVKYYKSDYSDPATLEKALEGVYTLIDLTPGFIDNAPLIAAAAKDGVQVYFPSQFGCDYEAAGIYTAAFSLKVRNSATARNSGIPKTVELVTGFFADWIAKSPLLFNIDAEKKTIAVLGSGENPNATTSLTDIARSLASLAYRAPSDLPDKVRVYSDHITVNRAKELYEKYHNVKLDATTIPVDELIKRAEAANAKFKNRDPSAGFPEFLAVLQGLTAHPANPNDFSKQDDRELVNPGLWKWISYEDAVKQVVESK